MRTSNKILLMAFALVLITLTSIYGAVYVKYKNGDFITPEELRLERFDSYDITGVQQVSLIGLDDVTIIPSDTLKLELEKGKGVIHTFENGMLTLKGDTTITKQDGTIYREKSYQEVVLYLPYDQQIKSDFCRLQLKAGKNIIKTVNLVAEIKASDVQFGTVERDTTLMGCQFNTIKVLAEEGSIDVFDNVAIKNMEVHLRASRFQDGNAGIDSLVLSADAASRISVSGKNIPHTKILSTP